MDEFGETGWNKRLYAAGRLISPVIWLLAMLPLTVSDFLRPNVVVAEERAAVAVLPFRVHTLKPFDYLALGFQKMLALHLEKRGLRIVRPGVTNNHPFAFLPQFEENDLLKMGKDLHADWVVAGSITQVKTRISLDLKVVDVVAERKPFSIFMVAEDIGALEGTAEQIAASIDLQISGWIPVDSVRVKGNQRIETEAILAVIRTRGGDKLDPDQLDKDLRDIYRMGFFEDIIIETEDGPKGKIVTFNVVEKPSIGKIVFEGNEEVDDSVLNEELGIRLYSILDQNDIKQSINRLKEYYRQQAYYNVDIKESIEPLPNNEVLLKYEIEEHEQVYVEEIRFLGNTRFDDDELKGIMETSERGFFSWITESGYLDKKMLEFDVHKINSYYHNNGFIKAKAGEPKITYEKDKGLTITIEIHEGEQYGIDQVSIEGDLISPAHELLEKIGIDKEKVFNRETLRKDVLALQNIYADEGYANAEVTPDIKEDDEARLIDITYRISKGQKVFFERINIYGNAVTRDKVIRRELKVFEGEYFSGKALRRSEQNLYRLGFFEDIQVRTKKGSGEDRMVLDIHVEERPTGNFSFGAGYSSVDKVVGTVQVTQNNFRGYGQSLSAAVKVGGTSSQFNISFTEPWLFDRPLSGSVQAYKWEREYDEYTKDSFGGILGLGFPIEKIDDFTRAVIQYAYDDAEISDIRSGASSIIQEMEGRSVSSSITLEMRRNSTDRAWNPSSGSINSISFEYAGGILGGDNYFDKYNARSAWYFPFPWATVFLVQGRWGYLERRSGGALPVYEKFFLGGINTVRGFEYAGISPIDPATGDKIGGEKMMVYNLEYRVPLIGEQGIIGLVFFDAGNVFTSEGDYTFSGIRKSAGGGVRWYSPMGPLRLEWGRNLDPKAGEPNSRVEFSIGTMF